MAERCGSDGLGGRAPRLGQARGPGAAARSPSNRHSGNLKTATPSPESHPREDANFESNDKVQMPQLNLSGLNIEDDVDQMPRHFIRGFPVSI